MKRPTMSEESIITYHFKLSKRDIINAAKYHSLLFSKSRSLNTYTTILMVIIAALCIYYKVDESISYAIVFITIMTGYLSNSAEYYLIAPFKARKAYRKHSTCVGDTEINMSENKLTVKNIDGVKNIDWKGVRHWHWGQTAFLIYIDNENYIVIPTDAVPDERKLTHFLQVHIGQGSKSAWDPIDK